MKVALVFPPYTHKIFSENLDMVDEEFCLAPPIILAYVAAILERCGHRVILIDAQALKLSMAETLHRLKDFRPDVLGFRAEAYHFHDALEWIRYFKGNLKLPVVAGGPNLSMYPRETLSHDEIDYGIIGEAIESLPKLLEALERGNGLDKVGGIIYRNDGKTVINMPLDKNTGFNSYPFPARHLLPNNKYYSFISQRKNFTIMLTSTGCPFGCSFCAIHLNNKYQARSPENVVDEIEICQKEFNVKEIDFFDAVMFLNKPRILAIFNQMKQRRLKIEWSCRSRVDVVDKDLLREAAKSGCRQIYYGIESSDPNILRAIKKEVTIQQITQAIKWSRNFGIRAMGFFMIGNPGETKESVRRSIEFAENLGLDFIQVCRTIPKPGTELNKLVVEKTGRDFWKEHISGKEIEGRIPLVGVELSERELESLTKEFYLRFYLRPRIILLRLLQLKSLSELIRYIRAMIRMLRHKKEVR